MSDAILTVGELIRWLQQFDEKLELEITYDSGYGTGAGLSQEGIHEENGKLKIEVIS